MPTLRSFVPLLTALMLSACAAFTSSVDDPENWPAEKFYQEGKRAMDVGDYEVAIEHFEDLIARFPFGAYAQQAQLNIAYAYYKFEEPESAVAAADQFIKLYPRHPRVDYAYYIKGLARMPTMGPLERWFETDPGQRDPRPAQEAYRYFSELIRKFPGSPYAADAAQRMIYLREVLARNELYAARFYMEKGAYVAAANRAKFILEHYDQTPAIPAALKIMSEAYQHLGLSDLAADARRVLSLNFPDTGASKEQPAAGGTGD
ncbi:MAG TPA: outer membrane protein assembly factor BamD [Gammaproteobacteria bacterium]|nr:outer membrane protein assembly factor BamD [Gammaproteobacteria bacterium]